MNQRQERIAGYIATCSGVLAGSFAGAMIGSIVGQLMLQSQPNATGIMAMLPLTLAYLCILLGAMFCCWMTLKSIRHPLAGRITALLLVFVPITGLGLVTANIGSLGSTLAIYLVSAVALVIASTIAYIIAYRFSRYARR